MALNNVQQSTYSKVLEKGVCMAGMNVAELFFTVAGKLNARVFIDLDKKVNQSNKKISSLGKGLGGILAGLGGAVAINQLIETGKELDSINKKFVIIGGSQEKANQLLKQSRDLAFKLGLPLTDVQEGMGKFLAGGIDGSLTQPELIKIFEDMSYAIAGLGLPADKAQRTFKALGDIIGKDQIYAEELTQQLGENMPGAAPQTAKALGVLQKELRKMMKDGKLGARTLLKMSPQFKEIYGKNALNNINGITGSLENMNSSFIELQRTLLTSGLTDIIIDIATELSSIMRSEIFKGAIKELGKDLKIVYGYIKSVAKQIGKINDEVNILETTAIFGIIVAIISGIGMIGAAITSALGGPVGFIEFLTIGLPLIVGAIAAMEAPFIAVIAVIGGVIYLILEFISLIKLMAEGKDISKMGGVLMPLARWLRDTAKPLNDFLLLLADVTGIKNYITYCTLFTKAIMSVANALGIAVKGMSNFALKHKTTFGNLLNGASSMTLGGIGGLGLNAASGLIQHNNITQNNYNPSAVAQTDQIAKAAGKGVKGGKANAPANTEVAK